MRITSWEEGIYQFAGGGEEERLGSDFVVV
jgi:hypothetical protein